MNTRWYLKWLKKIINYKIDMIHYEWFRSLKMAHIILLRITKREWEKTYEESGQNIKLEYFYYEHVVFDCKSYQNNDKYLKKK